MAIESDRLLELLPPEATVMHDHNRVNYNDRFSYENIECNVHLLRDLRKCTDNTQHSWSATLEHLISEQIVKRKGLIAMGDASFSELEVFRFFMSLDEALILGLGANQVDATHYYAKPESALLKRLAVYRVYYFAWVTNFDLPFSNNLSERSLRRVKTKLKVAGQFQHVNAAQRYATIKSYLETCYRHQVNSINALTSLTAGNPYKLIEHQSR